ncbi:DNA repair protein RecO [Sinanaerobacter sp. ZZT-01]|uniref:DNA repair protein RecO n=1 Tax=Sinanaerobacter sp. ZZT-01 TaxID=3111540 RepID=UPI002D795481|nr:DNA repair protein RecO [Sinanaerobacter sp. ZZT-01]WRR92886.1 DNA repair protein RecO [Sinanaerobacter sp. ZZT-01]
MYTDTEGIIFKQIKTVSGRRMVILFSKKFGKISAGTSINEKGKGKSALAMRPFTYGKYELYKNRDTYHINGAEVIKSYYRIGEDIEKYMCCSYILELTERVLAEDAKATEIFYLLLDFLSLMEERKKKFETLVLAYQVKLLQLFGSMPRVDACVRCGSKENLTNFSIKDGGVVCKACLLQENANDGLIYELNFAIVDILRYFLQHSLKALKNLALEEAVQGQLQKILKDYFAYHLDIKTLKSEGFVMDLSQK